jgi:hypothetical protein
MIKSADVNRTHIIIETVQVSLREQNSLVISDDSL